MNRSHLLIFFLQIPSLALAQDVFSERLAEVTVVGKREPISRLEQAGQGEALVISAEILRSSTLPSVADLLRQQGGVNFTSFLGSTGTGVPQLRGFGEGASSRVLILYDGLPMNRPDLATPVWFEFPIAGLEQVELQRGARTVRYGSSALAGVISLESRQDIEKPEWHFQASSGSWDTSLFRINGLSPTKSGWITGVSGDFFQSEGWRQNSAIDSRALQFSLSSPRDRPWQWQTTISGSDTTLENPGGLSTSNHQNDPRQSAFTRFGIGDQYVNDLTTLRTTQRIRFEPSDNQLWQLNASWTGRERELNFGAGSHTDHDLDSFAFDLSHDWKRQAWSGTWGIRGTADTLSLERFREQERQQRFATADLERQAIGAFARADLSLRKIWTLSGGLSWDAYDLDATTLDTNSPGNPLTNFTGGTRGSAWGSELSLELRPDETRRFWVRLDRVFRFPVLDEVAGYQGFILDTPLNANLEPETGYGLELGGAYTGDHLSASLTAFAQRLDGEILFDFNQNLNTNFARTRRLGVESRIAWEGENWSSNLNYQWIAAEFDDGPFTGRTIPLVAEHQLSAQVIWNPAESLQMSLEWEWLSDAYEGGDFNNTQSKLPGRSLVHLEGRYDMSDDWQIFGRIDNLFDERWASLKFLGQWYPGNGRGLTLGVKGQF